MIDARRMAPEPVDALAQAGGAAQLAEEQCDQLILGRQPPHPMIGSRPGDQPLEIGLGDPLHQVPKDAIVMCHGVDPIFVSGIRANV